jgi:tetraacyldisaccharide 4'-kinase
VRISEVVFDEKKRSLALACLRGVLRALSVVYGVLVWHRALAYRLGLLKSYALDSYVVSVGNITVGGTGKTPLVMALARQLRDKGHRVVVLSRGYKGASRGVCLVSDGRQVLVSKELAGDEPYLLAQRLPGVPVIVGRDRYAAGRVAVERLAPDVVLLDDGFQHLKLRRDLDIVTIDCTAPFGNNRLLPRGPLREPLSALTRASLFCLTHAEQRAELDLIKQRLKSVKPNADLFEARHCPIALRTLSAPTEDLGTPFLSGKSVVALSAIANPESFCRMLEGLGCRLLGRVSFPDHHAYKPGDLQAAARQAKDLNADCIVTTAKDAVRLPEDWHSDPPTFVLEIAVEIEGIECILGRIEIESRNARLDAQDVEG